MPLRILAAAVAFGAHITYEQMGDSFSEKVVHLLTNPSNFNSYSQA